MDYGLAKQLKDVGFPQQGEGRGRAYSADKSIGKFQGIDIYPDERIYYPTLTELIEACGPMFGGVFQWENGVKLDHWEAVAAGGGTAHPESSGVTIGKGSTPEEALTRLWLALNKK